MRIVLDTNVLVSGLLSPNGVPAQVLNLVLNKRLTLLVDARILLEYAEVLRRPKFQFNIEWVNPLLDFIRMESELITPDSSSLEFSDPDDRMFWEVAITGNALYIVSGNTKHFPVDSKVVTPVEFLERYHHSLH